MMIKKPINKEPVHDKAQAQALTEGAFPCNSWTQTVSFVHD